MKEHFILITLLLNFSISLQENPKFLQVTNPDQQLNAAGGGDSGEFLRRNQPPEHLLIPISNTVEAVYPKIWPTDIKEYRIKLLNKVDPDLLNRINLNNELNQEILPNNLKTNKNQYKKGISQKVLQLYPEFK